MRLVATLTYSSQAAGDTDINLRQYGAVSAVVSPSLPAGSYWALVGRNSSGTLERLLMSAQQGSVAGSTDCTVGGPVPWDVLRLSTLGASSYNFRIDLYDGYIPAFGRFQGRSISGSVAASGQVDMHSAYMSDWVKRVSFYCVTNKASSLVVEMSTGIGTLEGVVACSTAAAAGGAFRADAMILPPRWGCYLRNDDAGAGMNYEACSVMELG